MMTAALNEQVDVHLPFHATLPFFSTIPAVTVICPVFELNSWQFRRAATGRSGGTVPCIWTLSGPTKAVCHETPVL
jgi:hypothetical protein